MKPDLSPGRGLYALAVASQVGLLAVAGRLAETYVAIDCPIRSLTGLQCPGCGSTRCLSAIGSGNLIEGFRHNPLMSSLLATMTLVGLLGAISPKHVKLLFASYKRHQVGIALLAVSAISVFTVGRNVSV